jgi:hypothetical protein
MEQHHWYWLLQENTYQQYKHFWIMVLMHQGRCDKCRIDIAIIEELSIQNARVFPPLLAAIETKELEVVKLLVNSGARK